MKRSANQKQNVDEYCSAVSCKRWHQCPLAFTEEEEQKLPEDFIPKFIHNPYAQSCYENSWGSGQIPLH